MRNDVSPLYTPVTRNPAFPPAGLSIASLLLAMAGTAGAATLSVGPGKTYVSPCAAITAAKDGDTIEIVGDWTYSGDVCAIAHNNLTIRGVQGRPTIDAAERNHGGKGTWVVIGNNITVENVEMKGSKVPDGNGAALRLEGTNFTLRNAFIHDNENGILSGVNRASNVVIEHSEFGHNGSGTGQTHNLYIGNAKSLTFRYNYSHDANIGHNLKSRAMFNMIAYNRFSSTPPGKPGSTASGKPSYEIDLPNAGTSYLIGNVIEQPAINDNSNIVAYGEEGAINPGQDLYVINNTFLNDFTSGTFLFISGKVSTPALIQNNVFAGPGTLTTQSSAIQKDNHRLEKPGFIDRAGLSLRPLVNDMVQKAGPAADPWSSGLEVKGAAHKGRAQDAASR
ncbi:right-handed parallel beta-helix repeat-containing protein [Massilia putida]|uniref:right-handed parallel beta-helix repeat-containing protein n=1 Tax=Massilia putida TaxID=1141883 RepID=UPI000A9B8485|nr:right-handed parallel beta-helix repeat-containing protein [Massilia putida]